MWNTKYFLYIVSSQKATYLLTKKKRLYAGCFISVLLVALSACNKFVDVSPPINKIANQELFKDDAGATSAVLGIYSQIASQGLTIVSGGMTAYAGLASDELVNTSSGATDLNEFQTNSISSDNFTNQFSNWTIAYRFIYQANACIEGITNSTGISPGARKQLLGECKVVRSFIYFYLIQLYGDIPLITATAYNTASVKGRSSTQEVYNLIISDLTDAKKLLTESYPSDGRARPNLYTAEALLARIYLYTGNWQLAENEASTIINSSKYSLLSDLNKVFLIGSNEAIWQVNSVGGGLNTREGATFVISNPNVIPGYLISDQLMSAFELNDPRKNAWIGKKTISSKTYYFPYKYKIPLAANQAITESYTIFRLPEQYLIRAESRIRQGKISDGISDINIIRKRARGSDTSILHDLSSSVSEDQALSYLLNERRTELMTEWGQRWFDLKRLHLSGKILQPIKTGWKDTDTLFPIPSQEILLNKNLTQNSGYNQ